MNFRWLGVAGVELSTAAQTLLLDPYLTRVSLLRMLGRARSDCALIETYIKRGDYVLVTHAHIDHLLDVPEVLRLTGGVALGSDYACRLLFACGVPTRQVRRTHAGERFALGEAQVRVLPVDHMRLLGLPILPGPLPPDLRSPLRAFDYRIDEDFAFLIEWERLRILNWSGGLREPMGDVDIAFANLSTSPGKFWPALQVMRPRLLVPIHWDNFLRPLNKPLRQSLVPAIYFNLRTFRARVARVSPETRVCIPKLMRRYSVTTRLSD